MQHTIDILAEYVRIDHQIYHPKVQFRLCHLYLRWMDREIHAQYMFQILYRHSILWVQFGTIILPRTGIGYSLRWLNIRSHLWS